MRIGLDIGATNIKGVLVKNRKIIKKIILQTKTEQGKNIIIKQILDALHLLYNRNVDFIGIGAAGVVKNGTIVYSANMSRYGWKNINLESIVKNEFRTKTTVINDGQSAAWGEFVIREKREGTLVCLTIGTGIGGGIVINGKLINGTAGEFGHMTIDVNGRKCTCGNKGCLEEYVSDRAIRRIARSYGLEATTKEIINAAKKGNQKAIRTFEVAGKYLGIGLSNIVNILDPDIIVIGGGISKAGRFLLAPAKREMKKRVMPMNRSVKIEKTRLGVFSSAYGAAML
ncbi:MAG: ROK family protein [Candidatus Diapherotrites archaeon]|nr:ROK family protein [Candidatus Diapherotrites archaeon]